MTNSRNNHRAMPRRKDTRKQKREHLESLYVQVNKAVTQSSPISLGLRYETFVYIRNCVLLRVRDEGLAEPQADTEWVTAIVREHCAFQDFVMAGGSDFESTIGATAEKVEELLKEESLKPSGTSHLRSLIAEGPYRIVDPLVDALLLSLGRSIRAGKIRQEEADSAITETLTSLATRDTLRNLNSDYLSAFGTFHRAVAVNVVQWNHALICPPSSIADPLFALGWMEGQYVCSREWATVATNEKRDLDIARMQWAEARAAKGTDSMKTRQKKSAR